MPFKFHEQKFVQNKWMATDSHIKPFYFIYFLFKGKFLAETSVMLFSTPQCTFRGNAFIPYLRFCKGDFSQFSDDRHVVVDHKQITRQMVPTCVHKTASYSQWWVRLQGVFTPRSPWSITFITHSSCHTRFTSYWNFEAPVIIWTLCADY